MSAPRLTSRLFLRIDPLTLDKLRALAADDGRPASDTIRRLVTAAFADAAASHVTHPHASDSLAAACPICHFNPETPR